MAFKISPKFKTGDIKSKSLDIAFLGKYYKAVQQTLLKKTSVENTTEYFFCQDFTGGEPLLIFGAATAKHKKVFHEAGKGKDGFDKGQISIGTCFVLVEDNKRILCLQPNLSLGKARKAPSLKILNKVRRQSMKQFEEVRWLEAPLMATVDGDVEKVSSDADKTAAKDSPNKSSTEDQGNSALVPRADVVKRAKELQRGIDKLKNDLMPRYKEQQVTPRDGAFVKALRKAALVFLTKLTQTDEKTKAEFASNKEYLDVALPQWKELESRLGKQESNKNTRKELKNTLEKAVKIMTDKRKKIIQLLKRVDLKSLA